MAKMSTNAGRVAPPQATRFRKGKSGNPAGRPKGSVSLEAMTRKFALKKEMIKIEGRPQRLTRLEITIRLLMAAAAQGKPSAVRQFVELSANAAAAGPKGGFLLVPPELSHEEFRAMVEERNGDKVEPGTAINIEAEEFLKAVRGEPTELGEALRAFKRKYRE